MIEKAKKIYDLLISLCKSCYNGSITVHIHQGNICKVEKHEALKI